MRQHVGVAARAATSSAELTGNIVQALSAESSNEASVEQSAARRLAPDREEKRFRGFAEPTSVRASTRSAPPGAIVPVRRTPTRRWIGLLTRRISKVDELPDLGHLPLVVLSHGIADMVDPGPSLAAEVSDEFETTWQSLQRGHARMSRVGRLRVRRSGHMIADTKPGLINSGRPRPPCGSHRPNRWP